VIGAAAGGGGGAVTAVDMAPVVSAINELKSVITQISPVEIQMDGARIAEAVYATNSYKKR
jgi:threonine aldolase